MTDPPIPIRPDLELLANYHSPQVEAEFRLNTNESPVGPPARWVEDLRQELGSIDFNRYPDREATELRKAVGALHGVGPDSVFCANGSNEVIQTLMLAFGGPGRKVALFEPTYQLHRHIAGLTGTDVVSANRGPDYELEINTVDYLLARHRPEITFLCSPNNPTGRSEPAEVVSHVLGESAGLVVVDEAYGQFAPSSALDLLSGSRSSPPLSAGDLRAQTSQTSPASPASPSAESRRRLVVVRTFSKTWAMAACRLGYLVADPAVVEACLQVALPYHLDSLTQLAGRLALRYEPEMSARVEELKGERDHLVAELSVMDVTVWPSDANFVLFRPLHVPAKGVWQRMLDRSVLVRDCSSWSGLQECLRVTVGTADENKHFLAALSESLKET